MSDPRDEPTAGKCTACQAPLAPGEVFCKRCGAPQPGAPTCPRCGAIAGTSPDGELVLKCQACGAPRVVVEAPGVELSGNEQPHLEKASKARTGRVGWWIAAVAAVIAGVGTLGVTALVSLLLGMSFIAAGIGLALTIPFVLLAVVGFRKAGQRTEQVRQAVDAAWMSAAKDIAQQSKEPVTAEQLAEMLPLSVGRSERLLAQLAVDDMLSSDITPEGRLSFAPAMRIESTSRAAELEAQAELEQQAVAEAEAAAAQARARKS